MKKKVAEPVPNGAWAEIQIEFHDGASTLFHVSPDDDETEAVIDYVEEQGWRVDEISGWGYTGNYTYPGE